MYVALVVCICSPERNENTVIDYSSSLILHLSGCIALCPANQHQHVTWGHLGRIVIVQVLLSLSIERFGIAAH